MKIYSGTSGFGYREWKGKFYPEKIPARDMLRFYSERLNTVEINNTFYRMPKEDVVASWADQVPDDFAFAVKAPQVITHFKQLRNAADEAAYFFRSVSVLDRRLGPVLFQFPKSFKPDYGLLKDFLDLIPGTVPCAFEFRNPSWFDGKIPDLLRIKKCSVCIADTDESPVNEIISTAPWGYLRLRRSEYTDEDLSHWMERILAQQWDRAFVFFKHEEEARGPSMAVRFREIADSLRKKKRAA